MHLRPLFTVFASCFLVGAAGCADDREAPVPPLAVRSVAELDLAPDLDPDAIYVDPYVERLTNSRLSYMMRSTRDRSDDLIPLELSATGSQGGAAVVAPYPEAPGFQVTVEVPASAGGLYRLGVPSWDGRPENAPRFGHVNVYRMDESGNPVAVTATVTTNQPWPWMDPGRDMLKLRVVQESSSDFSYRDFERLEPGDTHVATRLLVEVTQDRPRPFRSQTVVYDEGDGD